MKINNILVVGTLGIGIKQMVENELDLKVKVKEENQVSMSDYLWADCLATYALPQNFSWGNIKWIHTFTAGVNNYVSIPWKRDVMLTRTINVFGDKISEYVLSYILKSVQLHDKFIEDKKNKRWNEKKPLEMKDNVAMILGTGNIGKDIAKTLKYFGMTVIGVNKSRLQYDNFDEIITFEEINKKGHIVNWVINILPATKYTTGLIDYEFLSNFREIGFINVGRGATVVDNDLIRALDEGLVREAILDVFEKEPLPKDHSFWEYENITITPHISGVTTEEDATRGFMDTLKNILEENKLENIVDIDREY